MSRRLLFAATLLAVAANIYAADSHADRLGYDPRANPFDQYHAAIEQAKTEHKLVLVIAGGDWCRWCHLLSRFMDTNADVGDALHETFVVMKVYVGDENYNELFFSQLPEARGAPHFWIISPDRDVLASQSTAAFEHGRNGYDKQEFLQFIAQWRQHTSTPFAAR